MATQTQTGRTQRLGNRTLVLAFFAVQAVAFAAAYLAEQPTWYAVFVVFSTSAVAYAYERRRTGVVAAGRFLGAHGLAAVGAVLVDQALRTVLEVLFGVSEVAFPLWFVTYVLLGTRAGRRPR